MTKAMGGYTPLAPLPPKYLHPFTAGNWTTIYIYIYEKIK
jgi:hypothetical protein